MTHTGKIGRLPTTLRDQLGHRLEDGLAGAEILDWLNQLPEVQQIMDDHFDGRPITEQNLSDWRQAGHLEWIRREEARQAIVGLAEQADDVHDLVGCRHLVDEFALVVVAEIHRLSRLLLSDEVDLEKRWQRLREINRELAQLRKQDHEATKLRLMEERCAMEMLKEKQKELRSRLLGADEALQQRIRAEIRANQAAWDEQSVQFVQIRVKVPLPSDFGDSVFGFQIWIHLWLKFLRISSPSAGGFISAREKFHKLFLRSRRAVVKRLSLYRR